MTRCLGYVRVSTAKQGEGVSLSQQRDGIRQYASRHGLEITEWFEEKETAAKRGRRIFNEVLRRLRKGEAQGLIVHKIDRSARNLRDWAELGELMDQGIQVHFAHESLDLNSRGGRLSADIQAVVAADFVRNLSEETRKGHRGRLKQGIYPFPAPIGYVDTGPGKLKSIDPILGPMIREAFELYSSGEYSLRTLEDEMYRRGLRSRSGKRIRKALLGVILHNPFYVGLMRIRTLPETFPGQHEKLVSHSLFNTVQARLEGKFVGKSKCHQFLFRQVFGCAHCGRMLVGERQKGHVYYRCHQRQCPSLTVREEKIDEAVRGLLGRLFFTRRERRFLDQELERRKEFIINDGKNSAAALERDLELIQTRISRVTTAYLEGDLDRETFCTTKESLIEQKSLKGELLEEERRNPGRSIDRMKVALELATDPLLTYEKGTDSEKRDLVRTVCSNRTLRGQKLSVELAFPFKKLARPSSVSNGLPFQDDVRTGLSAIGSPARRTPQDLSSIVEVLWTWAKTSDPANSGAQ